MTDKDNFPKNELNEGRAEPIEQEMNKAAPSEIVVNLQKPHVGQRREADKREAPLTVPPPKQNRSNG